MKIKLISAAVLAGLLFGSQAAVAEESLLWAAPEGARAGRK